MKWLIPTLTVTALLAYLGCSGQVVRFPQGSEKGQCYGNRTCNDGLVCSSSNICVISSEGGSGGDGEGGAGGQGGAENGGNSGAGGVSDTGGNQDTGGTTSSGGDQGSGGDGSGGASDTGGTQGSGGSSAAGGSSGSGGTTAAGTNACNATAGTNTVAFCNGQALGAMTGWGWVALGSADTLSDPTCDTGKAAITFDAPCLANTNWNKADALCMSGSIPALDATDPDYTGNWGVQIGVNAKDPNAGMGTSWKTLTISVSGTPTSGLRAVVHKNGEDDTKGYCLAMTPGEPMAITDFKSECWLDAGDALTEADSASIDKVGVQVTSTATAITVSDLCMTKIEFGN
jgi:hypothetical protein